MLPAYAQVPVLDCRASTSRIAFDAPTPSASLRSPALSIPSDIQEHVRTAADHLRAGRLVAFPTETVYGLGGATLDDAAVRGIYALKGRPADNPLIVHVSSLDMLDRLLPPEHSHSELYEALMQAFWPGPLTLLFPHTTPPPPPAPQTRAIRIPAHPLARALIHTADTPVSAPSANSSGRPSPTTAQHVAVDLGRKRPAEGQPELGCILDGGACDVGVESTVVDGLEWSRERGGTIKLLRPGGAGVEALERVVRDVERRVGLREGATRVVVHGKERERERNVANGVANGKDKQEIGAREVETAQQSMPSTPGMKYKHYSPSVPVFLLLPNDVFPSPPAQTGAISPTSVNDAMEVILRSLADKEGEVRVGLMHFSGSALASRVRSVMADRPAHNLRTLDMGRTPSDAARALFAGLLSLEGARVPDSEDNAVQEDQSRREGVDVILVEGCREEGLGLAVMERVRKAVGGGGQNGKGLDVTSSSSGRHGAPAGCFWVDVGERAEQS